MDIKGIHATLKITLSPKDHVELLTLMIKDVEEMIEWGEKQKSKSKRKGMLYCFHLRNKGGNPE